MRCDVIGCSFPSQAQALGTEPGADEESVRHNAVEWRPDVGDQRELFSAEQQGTGASHVEIDIETLAFIEGQLPARARGMVVEWATLHQEELREAFRRAEAMEAPSKIAPLL
jgi:hypothetical protein